MDLDVVPPKFLQMKGAILNYVIEKYGNSTATEDQLREAVRVIGKRAFDKRTQDNSYIKPLLNYKLIAEITQMGHKLYKLDSVEVEERKRTEEPIKKENIKKDMELDDVLKKYI